MTAPFPDQEPSREFEQRWDRLKVKINEAMDLKDATYLELGDIDIDLVSLATDYAGNRFKDVFLQRNQIAFARMRERKETLKLGTYGLVSARGDVLISDEAAKRLVLEMLEQVIRVRREVGELRNGG